MRIFVLSSRFFVVSALLVASLAGAVHSFARVATEVILMPVLSFIRNAPVSAAVAIIPVMKAIAFRIIRALKPEYADSYRTNGQSIRSDLRPA